MNNEPVAWIAYDEFGDFMLEARPEGDYPWQPLYTHPAKPLSNVVVASATCSCGKVMEVTNLQEAKTLTDMEILESANKIHARIPNNIGNDFLLISFARAILRKAQE